jgi:hypothetical protein
VIAFTVDVTSVPRQVNAEWQLTPHKGKKLVMRGQIVASSGANFGYSFMLKTFAFTTLF